MMEERTLATEMLHELKAQSKRWFIIAIVELVLLVGSNIGWLLYESQYEDVTTTTDEVQTMEDIDNSANSNYTQTIKWGDIIENVSKKNCYKEKSKK